MNTLVLTILLGLGSLLAGFLGAMLPERRVLVMKVLEWIKAGFRQVQEVASQAKDQVEAFRKVSQVERYLESDLSVLKGLLPIEGEGMAEELVWLIHANVCNGEKAV